MTQVAAKSSSSLFKWLGLPFVAVLLLLVLSFAFSPYLISEIIQRQLTQLGFNVSSVVHYPTKGYLSVSSLTLKPSTQDQTDSTSQLLISFKNIKINYGLKELFLLQKINSVTIDQANVILPEPNNNQDKKLKRQINLASYLPHTILSKLPLESLTINKFLVTQHLGPDNKIALKGKAALSTEQFMLSFSYIENQQATATAKLIIKDDDQFNFSLGMINQAKTSTLLKTNRDNRVTLVGKLKNLDNLIHIDMEQTVELNQLKLNSIWLTKQREKNLLQLLTKLTANANIKHQISLPATISLDQNKASNFLNSDIFNAMTINSSFDLSLSQLNPTTPLANPAVKVDQLQLSTTGTLALKQAALTINLQPKSSITLHNIKADQFSNNLVNIDLESELTFSFKEKILINDFAVTLDSSPWSSAYGTLQHLPSNLTFEQIDIPNQQIVIDFNVDQLSINPILKKQLFSQLDTNLEGHLKLNNNRLSVGLAKNTSFNFKDIQSDQLWAKNLIINTENNITGFLSLKDSSYDISDLKLRILPNSWLSTFGTIKHQNIALVASEINPEQLSFNLNFKLDDFSLAAKDLPFKTANLTTSGTLQSKDNQLLISLDKGLQASIQQLVIKTEKNNRIKNNVLNLQSLSKIQFSAPLDRLLKSPISKNSDSSTNPASSLALKAINISPLKIILSGSAIFIDKHQLNYQSLKLNIKQLSLDPLFVSASSHTKNLALKDIPLANNLNILGYHNISGSYHNSIIKVQHKNLPLKLNAKIDSRHNFKNIFSSWQLDPIDLASSANDIVNNLQLSWPKDLEITSGIYQQHGKIDISDKKITASVRHSLENVSLSKEPLSIDNIKLKSESIYKNDQLQQVGNIDIQRIEHSIPITNISANFKLNNLLKDNSTLQINDLQADFLQGQLQLKSLNTPVPSIQGNSILTFTNLPLNNVLALEQQPSLIGSGKLSGTLPFRFKGQKLWIDKGKVSAMDKGYIRYQANDSVKAYATSNAGLNIALKVLEDFQYNNLEINMDYSPDGKLFLKNNLSGSNPKWQQGHPIDFSINIEENILQLLKTLQFSDNLTQKIQDKIQGTQ